MVNTLSAMASLIAVLALFTFIWHESVKRQDAGIVDLVWALGFVLVAGLEAIIGFPPSSAGWTMLALVSLWAGRLSLHLIARHRRSHAEDARYAAMRQAGGPLWPKQSLWRVFWVQGLALWAVATPIHASLLQGGSAIIGANFWAGLGLTLFGVGFLVESLADWQLTQFKADPAHQGQLCTTGLFALCRHPNYFGEILVWWGLGLVALGLTGRVWALAGPALITFFLIRVSGVPPLEAVLAQRPGFAAWAARTPALWPRLFRKPLP
jgi:steroid 5-alpha reductase family enzyme